MSAAGGGLSKAAKKNKKRHAKKTGAPGGSDKGTTEKALTPASLLPLLKEQLEQAKMEKNTTLASELREQVWVLNDIVAGVKTDMPERELNPIMAKLGALLDFKGQQSKSAPAPSANEPSATPEKRIKNLQKRLDQIEKLKERKAKGEKLESGQVEKIESEDKILKEIEELEALLGNTSL